MTKTHLLTSVIGIFAFAVVFSACSASKSATEVTPTSAPVEDTTMEKIETTPEMTPALTPAPTGESMTKEGGKTISEVGSYTSPGGPETITFTLVVDDKGVITEAKAEPHGTNPTTKIRQGAFAAALPQAVQGKKLADLTVDKIGGSSLTSGAFRAFVAKAKTEL